MEPTTIVDIGRERSPEVLAILNEAIVNSTALYDYRPRPLSAMDAWFGAKEAGGFPVIGVVDAGGGLAGFATYGVFRAWPAYRYTVEHSVYVEVSHRGKGLGERLLRELIARAERDDRHVLVGGIDAANEPSRRLHRKLGFEWCGTVRQAGYKFGRWLDLEFHQRVLATPASPSEG